MVTVLEHEFYLSEILDRWVFVKKHRIGRLGDLAIVETGKLPEVTHVIVSRPFGYPRLTVPWDKVRLISNNEIVLDIDEQATAQFERAPQENLILLHDHILDKKILDMDDHEVEIVYDVKLAFQNGKLYAAEVDFSHYRALRRLGFRKLAKLLTNRNDENRVSWLYVQPLPEQLGSFAGNIKLKVPKAGLSDIHPVDLADILEELEGGQRVALFNALDAEQASDTLEEVEPRVQRELIRAIEKERAAQLINEMSPAQAADILAILPRDQARGILKLLDQEKSSKVEHIIEKHDEQILLYGSGSAELIKMPAATPADGRARPLSRAGDGQGCRDVCLRDRCGGDPEGGGGYQGNGCGGAWADARRHHDRARDFPAEGRHAARGGHALRAVRLSSAADHRRERSSARCGDIARCAQSQTATRLTRAECAGPPAPSSDGSAAVVQEREYGCVELGRALQHREVAHVPQDDQTRSGYR